MSDEHETGYNLTNDKIAQGRHKETVREGDTRTCPVCHSVSIIICPNDYQRFEYCDSCGLLEERDPCKIPDADGGGWLVWAICWTKNLIRRLTEMFR